MRVSLPALKGRSKWKGKEDWKMSLNCIGPHIVNFPINLSQALAQKVPIRTQARACTILPEFVGFNTIRIHKLTDRLKFLVHNGMEYIPVQVTDEMIGHKLGEFASTRKMYLIMLIRLTTCRAVYRPTRNK